MYKNRKVKAIITAGGKGLRMGSKTPKQFLPLGGETILGRTVRIFRESSYVDEIIITLPEEYLKEYSEGSSEESRSDAKSGLDGCTIVSGGEDRQSSVGNALNQAAPEDDDIILIHDGVRPYCDEALILRVIEGALEDGAAVPGIHSVDTIRHEEQGTLERDKLFRVQTPQGFLGRIIREAYLKAVGDGFKGTDDASLVERLGYKVKIVEGSERNIKITTKEDMPKEMRIGTGFDVHRLVEGRKLILCGVEIPYSKGLDGHSDADVAVHALMDALLGAAGLPDIGRLFPDSSEEFRGISSMLLLGRVMELLENEGVRIINVDLTIICQQPKLSEYMDAMRASLQEALGLEKNRVGLKATTTEKLGFTGRGEGIACEAVCLIER